MSCNLEIRCRPIVCIDSGCQSLVVPAILENVNDGFRRKTVPNSVSPRLALAVQRSRTSAFLCVFPVGGDLFLCGHSLWTAASDCGAVASS